jgi:hypothetical protein
VGISLKSILQTVAPTLASALPGPLGAVAKKLIGTAIGKPDASEDEIAKTLATANPDILLKIKELDTKFKEDMRKLDIDFEKIASEDRANARAREIATKDWTPKVLAIFIIGGYSVLQYYILGHIVPASSHDIVIRSLGILEAAIMLILGYYFGSSASSHKKDETIGRIAESD